MTVRAPLRSLGEAVPVCHARRVALLTRLVLLSICGVALWAPATRAACSLSPPELLVPPEPTYPDDAFVDGAAGDVVLDVELNADGDVAWLGVSVSPDPRLSWAALGAMTNATFAPAQERCDDGRVRSTPVRFSYALTFAIDEAARQQRLAAIAEQQAAALAEAHAAEADHHHVDEPVVHESVVRGRRPRENITRTLTQATATMDEAAIANVRGRSLAGTLVELPGVTLVESGPGLAKPVVRGLFGRRLQLLTDGVRHEGQDWGIDHAPEVDPQGAGQITVVKGAAGVRFGPDAIGGVVLVEPRALRLDPGVDGDVAVFGNSNGYGAGVGGRVDVVLPQAPAFVLRLEGNLANSAAMSTPTYVLGNTANNTFNVGATLGFHGDVLERAVTAKLSYRRYQTDQGICFCLKVNTPADLQAALEADAPLGSSSWTTTRDIARPYQHVSHDLALARVNVDLGETGALTATYAFQLDLREEYDTARASVTGPQYQFNLQTHAVDLAYVHPRWRHERWSLTGQVGSHFDVQLHSYSGLQLIPNFRRTTGGVFALERLVLDDAFDLGNLEFVAGARADGLLQTAFLTDSAFATQVRRGRLRTDDCALNDDVARCDKNLPAASLTLGARWHLPFFHVPDALDLQLDLSSASRFPDVDELYLGGRAPSLPVFGLGDAGLATERTWQASLGTELRLRDLIVEGGAFVSRINDYIAFGPELAADGTPIVDVLITGSYPRFSSQAVEAVLSGFDGGVVIAPGALFSLSGQAAVVRGLDLTHSSFLPFIPPNQARVELRTNLPDVEGWRLHGLTAATSALLVARQDRTDARSDFAAPAAGYALWNAEAHTTIDVGQPLTVGLEVKNILNQRYRDQLSLLRFFADQPGREVWLRASLHFDQTL